MATSLFSGTISFPLGHNELLLAEMQGVKEEGAGSGGLRELGGQHEPQEKGCWWHRGRAEVCLT